MADKVVVVKERRSGCGCGVIALLAIVAGVLFFIYIWGQGEFKKIEEREAFDRAQRGAAPVAPTTDTPPPSPSDAWKVGRSRDDMTDKVTYILSLNGLRVEDGIINYTPRLVLQLPQSARTSGDFSGAECGVWIEPEAIKRTGVVAEVRIDQKPAEKILLLPGQNRSAVFLPSGFAKRLDGSRTLIVRLETSLGKVRTFRFNLGGVSFYTLAKKLKRDTPAE